MDFNFDKRDYEEIDTLKDIENLPPLSKLSDQINYLLSRENNKELVLLKQSLAKYKQEIENNIKYGTPIENEHFKASLHSKLERLLLFIIYVPNKEIRDDKIRALFRWYFETLEHYKSLDRISYRTDKNVDEVYRAEDIPSGEILIQDDAYEMAEFSKHRTEIIGLEPPRERLKEFKYKKIHPPKKFRKDEKVMANLRFNLDRFHGKVGTANNFITPKSTFYATKTGQKWVSNSGIGVTNELAPINPNKEIKGGYSYNRPDYEYKKLIVEKTNIQAKNKELAEKRNQEEMKKYLDEFGKAKAKYKEEIERKYNHINIVKTTEKTFKVERDINELIEKEKNDEEKEIKEKEEQRRNSSPDRNTNIDNKVVFSRIKNIDNIKEEKSKSLLDINEQNKCFKVYLKNERKTLIDGLENKKEAQTPIKPDTLAFRIVEDKVLKARVMSAKICEIKEIDNKKLGYTHHYTPLSAYDYVNYENYAPEIPKEINKLERPRTASEFALRNFDKYSDNYLHLRMKMEAYKKEEIDKMTELVFNGCNSSKKIDAYVEAVQVPIIVRNKSTFAFSRPQTGLLMKPEFGRGKKKRKGNKKK